MTRLGEIVLAAVVASLILLLLRPDHAPHKWQYDAAGQRVLTLWEVARRGRRFPTAAPVVTWDNPRDWGSEKGAVAVTVCEGHTTIVFDPDYAAGDWDYFYHDIVAHEVAHAVLCATGDNVTDGDHGPLWRATYEFLKEFPQ